MGPSLWVNCITGSQCQHLSELGQPWRTLNPSMWFGGANVEGKALERAGADTFIFVAGVDAVGWLDSWFLLLYKRTNMPAAGPPWNYGNLQPVTY